MLSDLSDCNVWLLGGLSALRMTNLLRCNVYSGPVAGATFVEGPRPPLSSIYTFMAHFDI